MLRRGLFLGITLSLAAAGRNKPCFQYRQGDTFFKDLVRYPLAREGVYAPGGPAFLAHTKQKVINIVGLTALRLAFFMGYE